MISITKNKSARGTITLVTITNSTGARVVLSTVGAGIMTVETPGRDNILGDVVLGYADPADYFGDGPAAGKIPGRFANRIAGGRFTLDGKEYILPVNNGPNCLHGGPEGFHNLIWELCEATDNRVVFRHVSPDGEMGFPGCLTATAEYRWTDDFSLELTLRATTDRPTVVNLTNHAYWNLSGHNAGSILAHKLRINASKFLPTDQTLVPTGEIAGVENTPMDFRTAKAIGCNLFDDYTALNYGKGYDNCWVLDLCDAKMHTAAVLTDDASGRCLEIITDQPAAQVYTGNWLSGSPANKDGRSYDDYDGVAIECQDFPDAPNKPDFPSCTLRPGDEYVRHITYKFTVTE